MSKLDGTWIAIALDYSLLALENYHICVTIIIIIIIIIIIYHYCYYHYYYYYIYIYIYHISLNHGKS